MLDKYTWYVIDNKDENGKMYAHAWRIHNCNNLLSAFKQFPQAVAINACETKKTAKAIADDWNKCHKRNGNYMFDYPTF